MSSNRTHKWPAPERALAILQQDVTQLGMVIAEDACQDAVAKVLGFASWDLLDLADRAKQSLRMINTCQQASAPDVFCTTYSARDHWERHGGWTRDDAWEDLLLHALCYDEETGTGPDTFESTAFLRRITAKFEFDKPTKLHWDQIAFPGGDAARSRSNKIGFPWPQPESDGKVNLVGISEWLPFFDGRLLGGNEVQLTALAQRLDSCGLWNPEMASFVGSEPVQVYEGHWLPRPWMQVRLLDHALRSGRISDLKRGSHNPFSVAALQDLVAHIVGYESWTKMRKLRQLPPIPVDDDVPFFWPVNMLRMRRLGITKREAYDIFETSSEYNKNGTLFLGETLDDRLQQLISKPISGTLHWREHDHAVERRVFLHMSWSDAGIKPPSDCKARALEFEPDGMPGYRLSLHPVPAKPGVMAPRVSALLAMIDALDADGGYPTEKPPPEEEYPDWL